MSTLYWFEKEISIILGHVLSTYKAQVCSGHEGVGGRKVKLPWLPREVGGGRESFGHLRTRRVSVTQPEPTWSKRDKLTSRALVHVGKRQLLGERKKKSLCTYNLDER